MIAVRLQRCTAVALLAAAGVALGACGGAGGGSDKKTSVGGAASGNPVASDGSKIVMTAKDLKFTPTALTLKAAQASTIVLKNDDSIPHDFSVADAGFKLTAAGNGSEEKALTLDKPGTYQFHCSVPGHEAAGMKGEITVQ